MNWHGTDWLIRIRRPIGDPRGTDLARRSGPKFRNFLGYRSLFYFPRSEENTNSVYVDRDGWATSRGRKYSQPDPMGETKTRREIGDVCPFREDKKERSIGNRGPKYYERGRQLS